MLTLDYQEQERCAIVWWEPPDTNFVWVDLIRRLLFDSCEETKQIDAYTITIPWWNFVAAREKFLVICKQAGLEPGKTLTVTNKAAELLREARRSTQGYMSALNNEILTSDILNAKLKKVGFVRNLTKIQTENVRHIASYPAGATFSVPGAGKTTEALATFFYRATDENKLLVIAPKNAFAAWDEEIDACLPSLKEQFCRLKGGKEKIAKLLEENPRFMLITYQQLTRVTDLIAGHLAEHKTFIFLDESHRIKSGVEKQTARAVLSLSHLPVGKLIMSGTPMPQATEDLIPQFTFLYPEIPTNATQVIELIKPVYVRTNKAQLGLPPVTRQSVTLPMAPLQYELYKLMKFEVAREAASALNTRSKQAFRRLGRSVARILQFVSNPALLSSEIGFAHKDLLAAVLTEGDGPKIKYILKKARALANEGKKVLIWSSFVKNVEYIAQRLLDHGAVYIHGGVDAGDEDDDETREGKIKLFHDDPNVRILVANPAAASEGISLHRVCHHSLYLDRTFNAAHYLQSEDRIHRYGLKEDQETIVEIVKCENSIDETVDERLRYKIGLMAKALDDSSLCPEPVAIEPSDQDEFDEFSTGLSQEDIQALLNGLEQY
jgi:SNF2 family DNA or RNA helicase